MQGIIVYQGKYGATAQYAEWLSHDLNFPAFSADKCTNTDLDGKQVIVLGTSVYIGKLQIAYWLREHANQLVDKKLYLYIVSGTPANETAALDAYVSNNVPEGIASTCRVYFLPGRLRYRGLSLRDKLMLKMGAWLSGSKEKRKKMLTDYDDVHKANLQQVLNDINMNKAGASQPG